MNNRVLVVLVGIILLTPGVSACGGALPAETATPTPLLVATHTFTPVITPTQEASHTPIPTSTPTPIPTLTPTSTATPTPLLLALAETPLPPPPAPVTVGNAGQVSGLAEWRLPTVTDLAWTPDGQVLAVSDLERITFFDIHTRQALRSLYSQAGGIVAIDFSPGGIWLVAGSRRGSLDEGFFSSLELWSGPDWKPRGILYDVPRALNSMSFSPQGNLFAAAFTSPVYEHNSVELWGVSAWAIGESIATGTALEVAFSPDGTKLAVTPDRYAIRILDFNEGEWLPDLHTSFTGSVTQIAFSPDGSLLVSGHYDGAIRLWDIETGEMAAEFQSEEVIESLAFHPDGRLLATGGSYQNSLVRIWDIGTGLLLRTLEGHASGVSHVLFAPAGQYLVSASYDGTLRLWGIRP